MPFWKDRTAPTAKLLPSTVTEMVVPTFMVFGVMELTTGNWLIVVGSLAELLVVFVSPPPDTVAVLVTLEGALEATFTVRVMTE